MINRRDVVRIKVPYPDINAKLALSSHMYICNLADGGRREFVKCQTLKPYMLCRNLFTHYWDESPDIRRNPFKNHTRIDCDKLFVSEGVRYDKRLRTDTRPDVCPDLYQAVVKELEADGCATVVMDSDTLMSINPLVQKM